VNDTWVTVVGNLATEPVARTTGGGVPVLNLRVATTPRRRDGVTGEWKDAETAFLTVTCWRALAEHVGRSLHKGDPVVVHGRLLHKSYETPQGERRSSTEVEASALGPDLSRGTAAFVRAGRARPAEAPQATAATWGGPRWGDGEPGPGDGRTGEGWETPVEGGYALEEHAPPASEPLPVGV
jgi:single-strand DNA-binding protein